LRHALAPRSPRAQGGAFLRGPSPPRPRSHPKQPSQRSRQHLQDRPSRFPRRLRLDRLTFRDDDSIKWVTHDRSPGSRGTHKDCLPQRRPMTRDGLAAMTILILGGDDDDHAVFRRDFLLQRGVDAELLDSRWFPQSLRLGFDPTANAWSIAMPGGRRLDGRAIHAVYWRCYNGIATPALPDAEQAYIAANDA